MRTRAFPRFTLNVPLILILCVFVSLYASHCVSPCLCLHFCVSLEQRADQGPSGQLIKHIVRCWMLGAVRVLPECSTTHCLFLSFNLGYQKGPKSVSYSVIQWPSCAWGPWAAGSSGRCAGCGHFFQAGRCWDRDLQFPPACPVLGRAAPLQGGVHTEMDSIILIGSFMGLRSAGGSGDRLPRLAWQTADGVSWVLVAD